MKRITAVCLLAGLLTTCSKGNTSPSVPNVSPQPSASSATGRSNGNTALSAPEVPTDPSALGYLNLHKRHPDGAEGPEEFRQSYSSDEALRRLDQVREALESFAKLTEKTRRSLSESELREIGNTGGDMQTIGFHNLPILIEGTILKQEYQLNQLRYQVAQLQRERSEITAEELDRVRLAYRDATKALQVFWDTKIPGD